MTDRKYLPPGSPGQSRQGTPPPTGRVGFENKASYTGQARSTRTHPGRRPRNLTEAQRRKPPLHSLPFVKKDGVFIALKGPDVRTELSEAQKAIGILGGKVERVVEYKLGDVGDRTLILIRKISHTSTKYPRNTAKIKKQPLN